MTETTFDARPTSAQKSLALLEALAGVDAPLGVSDLGRLVGASRGTVHKQLMGLLDAGWVERDEEGRYGLSLTAARVGNAALSQAGLGRRIHDVLAHIAEETGEAVSIAALYRSMTVIVQRAESEQILHADIRIGTQIPLAVGASSHVLVTFALSPDARDALRARGVELPPDELVERVRAEGVARTVDELQRGISALSIPLYDQLRFKTVALTLAAPNDRMDFAAHEEALRRGRELINRLAS
jgi:DNA-binding IclR family transcriptional regulator